MAEAVGTLRIDLQANIANFSQGLKTAGGKLTEFQGSVDKFAKSFLSVGGLLTGVVVAGLISFGKECIQQAVEAEKFQANLNLAFGESAKDVSKWASDTAQSFKRTDDEIQQLVTGFKILFDAATPNAAAATALSKKFVQLTEDLAAFRRISSAEAGEALQRGLEGSAKALKLLGVDISDNAVKAKAAALGIKDLGVGFDEQQKVLIRSAIIYDTLNKKIGGTAQATQSLAEEQLKALDAQFKEFQQTLGEGLIPVLQAVLGFFQDLIKGSQLIAQALADVIGNVAKAKPTFTEQDRQQGEDFLRTLNGLPPAIHQTTEAMSDQAAVAGILGAAIKEVTTGTDALVKAAVTFDRAKFIQEHLTEFQQFRREIDPIPQLIQDLQQKLALASAFGLSASQAMSLYGRETVEAYSKTRNASESLEELAKAFPALGFAIRDFRRNSGTGVTDTLGKIADDGEEMFKKARETFGKGPGSLDDLVTSIEIDGEKATKALESQRDAISGIADELTDAAMGAESFSDAIKNIIASYLRAQIIKPLFTNALNGLFGVTPDPTKQQGAGLDFGAAFNTAKNYAGGLIGGIFGGPKALGGAVYPGVSYDVGEFGKERFTPGVAGRLETAEASRMGGQVNNWYIQTPNADSFARSRRQIARQQKLAVGGT